MAKRDGSSSKKATEAPATANRVDAVGVEQRVVAFAEQLGRVVGTVQAKAEGWLDRDALNAQVLGVRDSAADLLKHLAGTEMAAPARPRPAARGGRAPGEGKSTAPGKSAAPRKPVPPKKPAGSATNNGASGGRSGGVVDAPGKRHRQPIPNPPAAMASNTKTANTMASRSRTAKMKLTSPRRG